MIPTGTMGINVVGDVRTVIKEELASTWDVLGYALSARQYEGSKTLGDLNRQVANLLKEEPNIGSNIQQILETFLAGMVELRSGMPDNIDELMKSSIATLPKLGLTSSSNLRTLAMEVSRTLKRAASQDLPVLAIDQFKYVTDALMRIAGHETFTDVRERELGERGFTVGSEMTLGKALEFMGIEREKAFEAFKTKSPKGRDKDIEDKFDYQMRRKVDITALSKAGIKFERVKPTLETSDIEDIKGYYEQFLGMFKDFWRSKAVRETFARSMAAETGMDIDIPGKGIEVGAVAGTAVAGGVETLATDGIQTDLIIDAIRDELRSRAGGIADQRFDNVDRTLSSIVSVLQALLTKGRVSGDLLSQMERDSSAGLGG
jgi:hypothetical protein